MQVGRKKRKWLVIQMQLNDEAISVYAFNETHLRDLEEPPIIDNLAWEGCNRMTGSKKCGGAGMCGVGASHGEMAGRETYVVTPSGRGAECRRETRRLLLLGNKRRLSLFGEGKRISVRADYNTRRGGAPVVRINSEPKQAEYNIASSLKK